MTFLNDHIVITAVILGAVSFYVIEMLFFGMKWRRLWERLNEEGNAQVMIQELQAEMDVLAGEVAELRRQLMHQGEGWGSNENHFPESNIPVMGFRSRFTSESKNSAHEGERKASLRTGEDKSHVRSAGGFQTSAQHGFSRNVELLHRRVVELARSGMDSATIATECQLSQTEAELILSLNGIKKAS